MSEAKAEKPNIIPWPPLILIAMVALGFVLNAYFPIGWVYPPLSEFLSFLGIMLVFLAIAFDVWAMKTLSLHKTTIMPHKGSSTLVSSGPFAISRNPIYLGNVVLVVGLALLFGIVWHFVLAFIGGFLTSMLAIRAEEAHLAHNFPREWSNYQKKVRRWF